MNETIPLPRPRKSFSNFDKLGFEDFAVNLTSFIETERDFVDEALLISLHGKFGQGKSTFFEMWKEYLVTERPPRFAVISLNAWEADYDRDPLLAIVMGFVKHFENEGQQEESEQLKKIGGRVAKFSASIANQVVRALTKIDLLKAKEDSEEHEISILDRACFEEYADRQEAFRGLKDLLREAVKQSPLPIIVMVDELDRCRPDYAVEYLETIKHIFDLDGLVFVLGVDRQSLSSSVRALFGESLKFDEYFRKFVHRNVNLPSFEGRSPENHIQYNQIKKFVRHLVSQYLVSDSLAAKGRYCYLSWNDDQLKRVTNLCLDLKMSPRQVHEAFRVMAHSL
ncbi:P-loop NTPase fold protein [Verrucomicrobiaceae bacterium 227]